MVHNDINRPKQMSNSGFSFIFTYKTSSCGGLLTGYKNIITSPGYPENYPANFDCAWKVEVDPGQTITVSF